MDKSSGWEGMSRKTRIFTEMEHEIIYTDHYALIVSDEDYNPNDVILANDLSALAKVLQNKNAHILAESIPHKTELGIMYHQSNDWKKVIAHLPLDGGLLIEGLPLLPEFGQEDDVEDWIKETSKDLQDRLIKDTARMCLKAGYNKAKETYKYTEEDLRKAFTAGLMNRYSRVGEAVAETEFVQSLQQPKRPKYFECEMIEIEDDIGPLGHTGYPTFSQIPKKIKNAEGQTELVGSYI